MRIHIQLLGLICGRAVFVMQFGKVYAQCRKFLCFASPFTYFVGPSLLDESSDPILYLKELCLLACCTLCGGQVLYECHTSDCSFVRRVNILCVATIFICKLSYNLHKPPRHIERLFGFFSFSKVFSLLPWRIGCLVLQGVCCERFPHLGIYHLF